VTRAWRLSLAALVVAPLGACVQPRDAGGDWEPVEAIEGDLAANMGPVPTLRATPGCTLRVATFNVHYAGEPESLAANIRASQYVSGADVILLQETRAYDSETTTRTQRIADGLAMTWAYAPARTLPGGLGTHGIAILSRFPLENVAVRKLPYIEQPYHAESRNAAAADIVMGERRVRVVDLHLDVRLGPVDRVRQLDPAVRDAGERLLVGGDFNTAPWTFVDAFVPLTSSEAILGQEQAAVLDDFLAARRFTGAVPVETVTMRIPGFSMRLDNLYARGMPILASGVEHVDGSDHWPVWFDVDVCVD
jgi:endonuclease/exonuclease/phosphatase family metal-dependent hydrolase